MKDWIKENSSGLGFIIVIYLILTIFNSFVKIDLNNCNKTYPIDYIVYSKLFCEVKQ